MTKSKLLNFFLKYLILAVLAIFYWLAVPVLLVKKLIPQNNSDIRKKASYWSDPFKVDKK